MDSLKTCLVLILFLEQIYIVAGSNFVYQRDLSEFCRRRVMPSIFLGRQVVEANSRILQFSRLNLPYTCFISIRTESGSNMVMVIMELVLNDLKKSCQENSEQLLVYEMGETFGGYWGPIPNIVFRQEESRPTLYTLKTTQPVITTTEPSPTTTEAETTKPRTRGTTPESHSSGDYIEVEVPLLNISIHLQPSNDSAVLAEDSEVEFEYKYDVTPIAGIQYETKMVPLVQFQLRPGTTLAYPGRIAPGKNEDLRYDLDIVQEFTPDLRLTLPPMNPIKRKKSKQRYQATRRLNFRKHKTFWDSKGSGDIHHKSQIVTRRMNDVTRYKFPTTKAKVTENGEKSTQDAWQAVNDLMEKLVQAKDSEKYVKIKQTTEDNKLLEKISNMIHNKSVYLSPNLTIYKNINNSNELNITNDTPTMLPTRQFITNTRTITDKFTIERQTEISSTVNESNITWHQRLNELAENISATETMLAKETTDEQTPTTFAHHTMSSVDETKTNEYAFENTTDSITERGSGGFDSLTAKTITPEKEQELRNHSDYANKQQLVTGSMVGHESWENLVQAAPEMAVLLNQSVPYDTHNSSVDKDFNGTSLSMRKKKDIHSISIEESRPHPLSTEAAEEVTTRSAFDIADMQEFAQLVELEDDELQGRIALRYLRQYGGPSLFNLCNFTENTRRHVHLFNSSHIVLAITNFTLERMVVILTAARTLLSGEIRCPNTQIECQVAGARVCLDSLTACDGVPSCGSYDIYDEDRHQCHAVIGLQQNVYLAAFAFLAVLLTLMYAIHYWLNRCVPKVAEAFFVYTNGVENVMYLESIMRSPNDYSDMPKMIYQSSLYGDMNYDAIDIKTPSKSICQQCLEALCFCCHKKTDTYDMTTSEGRIFGNMPRKMYSFQELEISKMFTSSKETAVQTGDSLEINFLENVRNKNTSQPISKSALRREHSSSDYPIMIQDSLITLDEPLPEEYQDELSLINFINKTRLDTGKFSKKSMLDYNISDDMSIGVENEEREMRSVAFERPVSPQPGPSKRKNISEKNIPATTSSHKHLRFDEVTSTIQTPIDDEEEPVTSRRSIILRPGKLGRGNNSHLDTIQEGDENRIPKETRNFWGTSKAKKPKKKG